VVIYLQLACAWLASSLLNGIGVEVEREGTRILSTCGRGFSLDVASSCSGMRSMLALVLLASGLACFSRMPWFRGVLLVTAALPLALFANVLRIATVALVAAGWGQAVCGPFHDLSAFALFTLDVMGLTCIASRLERV